MLNYLIFAVTVVIVLIITVIYLYPGSKKSTTIPGPEPVDPLEGNFPDIKSSGSFNEFLIKIHEIYGSIASFWAGPQLCVSLACPALFKEQSQLFDRPDEVFRAATLLWGEDALFGLNGSDGRKKHLFIKDCFTENFINNFLRINNRLLHQQIKKWSILPTDQYFPLHENVSSFLIKSLVNSILGFGVDDEHQLNSLKGSLENVLLEVEHYILDVQDVDGKREKRLTQCKENIHIFLSRALKSRRENPSAPEKLLPIDKMLGLTDDEALNDLFVLLCDAFFKCSSFLTWFGYFMALETDIQEKVRQDLTSVNMEKMTLDDIQSLSYFQLVIKEVLRCASIVPYTARVQNVDIEIDTHKVPAGTPIIHALDVVSGDSSVFQDPDEFNPGRFKDYEPSKFAFHPFGFAGKRTCPGSQMAVAQVAIFYAHLLDAFELELAHDQVVSPHYGFYVKPREEVWMTLKARTSRTMDE